MKRGDRLSRTVHNRFPLIMGCGQAVTARESKKVLTFLPKCDIIKEGWCNGSTRNFDFLCDSSNLSPSANYILGEML